MSRAVGIRFESCGKVYCFKADGLELRQGENVVVESEMGVSIGRVVLEEVEHGDADRELKPVLRRVTEEDLQKQKDNETLCKEAFGFCNERIMARGLAMKLLSTDVTLDRRRIVFYFFAETRIDFRELVKDLAAKFRTRIELRQVGVRDAARIAGGLGVCGRELCCRKFLTSFEPISIKMAKKQELALNTSKLSGVCGRLMCCLGYEYDAEAAARQSRRPPRPAGTAGAETRPEETAAEAAPQAQQEGTQRKKDRRRRQRRQDKGPEVTERRKAEQREEGRGGEEKKEERPQEPRQTPQPGAEAGQAQDKDAGAGKKPPSSKPFRKRRRRRRRGKPGK